MQKTAFSQVPMQGRLSPKRAPRRDFSGVAVERARPDRKEEFRKWLDVFLISKGYYNLTKKGIGELGVHDDGYNEGKKAGLAKLKAGEMISQGRAGELYEKGLVERKARGWKDSGIRIAATGKLVEFLGKPVAEISSGDFEGNFLRSLLVHCKNSHIAALAEAGYAHSSQDAKKHAKGNCFEGKKPYPWQFNSAKVHKDREIAVAAIKWLPWKTGKKPADLIDKDFTNNKLGHLLRYFKHSVYLALAAAGYAHSYEDTIKHAANNAFDNSRIYPWERGNSPHICNNRELRVAATKWLAWKSEVKVDELKGHDFQHNLRGMVANTNFLKLMSEALGH